MMSLKRTSPDKTGFTIVELMVATLVFSIILVVITSGVIHFTADYYKGVNTSATQTAARNVANIIAQNLQYGGGKNAFTPNTATGTARYICVGGTQIDYQLGAQLSSGGGGYGAFVWKGPCGGTHPAGSAGTEYLGPNMRVTNINVTPVTGTTLYKVSVGVAYGDDDLLCFQAGVAGRCSSAPGSLTSVLPSQWDTQGKTVRCRPGAGSQFCATAHLNTEVVSRFDH